MKRFLRIALTLASLHPLELSAEAGQGDTEQAPALQHYSLRCFLLNEQSGISVQTQRAGDPQLSYHLQDRFEPLKVKRGVLSASTAIQAIPGEAFRLYQNGQDHSRQLWAELQLPEQASDYILLLQPQTEGLARAYWLDAKDGVAVAGTVTLFNGSEAQLRVRLGGGIYECEAEQHCQHRLAPEARQYVIQLESQVGGSWKLGYATSMKARQEQRTLLFTYKREAGGKQIEVVSFVY